MRYTGPACRLCRRVGDKLLLKGSRCVSPKCAMERRNVKPVRGATRRRRISERGLQLKEKQKARYSYGVLERQFRRFFAEAQRVEGITAENLVGLLERRLDNVVFRLGFADSRSQARQLVLHGHILVDARRCNVASRLLKVGETVTWHATSTKNDYYKTVVETVKGKLVPSWLALDLEAMSGRVQAFPALIEADARFDGKAIVEFYSK